MSYDSVFLGLLYSAQNDSSKNEIKKYCALFPKRMSVISPQEEEQIFAACIAMLFYSVKISDSLYEKRSNLKLLLKRISQAKINKASSVLSSFGFAVDLLNDGLERQKKIEKISNKDILKYAEPTAVFSGNLFRFTASINGIKENEDTLFNIGYNVGLVVYLIDSCIDIFDDLESEKFNALIASFRDEKTIVSKESKKHVSYLVLNAINEIKRLTEHLTLKRHESIIKNILCNGFPNHIINRVNKSIKQLNKRNVPLLKYLPHAAIIAGLCLLAPQDANSEWIWGNTATHGKMVGYGCTCFTELRHCCDCCDDKACVGFFEMFDCLLNPCVYFTADKEYSLAKPSHFICCQAPKALLTLFLGGALIVPQIEKIQETAQKIREERKYELRRMKEEEERERRRKIAEQEAARKKKQNDYIDNLTKDLRSYENDIELYSEQLGIEFPIHYMDEVRKFIVNHENEDLTKLSSLTTLINKKTTEARSDKQNLENSSKLYSKAQKLYEKAKVDIYKTRNFARYLEELDYCYQGLNLKDLKLLLLKRQWDEYAEIVKAIIADMERIRNEAFNQQPIEEQKTDEDKAYQILGIDKSASNDEIKKVWRKLSSKYHPDKAEQTTEEIRKLAEEKLKDINWAYEILKEKRKFK